MRRLLTVWFWLFCWPAFAGVSCSVPFNLQNNTTADATQVMANYNAILACLGNAAAAGSNSDITALTGLLTPIGPTVGGSSVYTAGASTGTANAQVIATPAPTGFTLVRGNSIIFIAGFTNTGATQINVNGQGLTNFFRASPNGPQAMTGGEIVQNNLVWAVYDGTQFQMLWTSPMVGGFGPLIGLSSAGTTDLGTVPTHLVNITGVVTITSFGSTASTTYPVYRLTFSGSLTLTHNGTSLILPGAANIQTAANDTAVALYLGSGNWQVVEYTPAALPPQNAQRCGFDQLSMSNGASNSVINWSYNNATLINSSGGAFTANAAKSGTLTITNGTGGTSTAGGMDGTAPGNNQMVAVWMIYNGTTWSVVGTKTAFPTVPTLPTGYFASCYAGSFKTGGTGNLFGEIVAGNEARYVSGGANLTTLPNITNGTDSSTNCGTATPGYTAKTVRGNSGAGVWFPSSAIAGDFVIQDDFNGGGAAGVILAPSTSYSGLGGTSTNMAPLTVSATLTAGSTSGRLLFEANTVQWCSTGANGSASAYGWRDAVNAN